MSRDIIVLQCRVCSNVEAVDEYLMVMTDRLRDGQHVETKSLGSRCGMERPPSKRGWIRKSGLRRDVFPRGVG